MDMYEDIERAHRKLARGQVWCRTCGRSESVKSSDCLRNGWPKCCGYTMTIDSPEERAALERAAERGEGP